MAERPWLMVITKSTYLILWLICTFAGMMMVSITACGSRSESRYVAIRRLIKNNLHFSAHLTFAVNTKTVEAVRKEVTETDIPVLIELLGDEENVVGIGAQLVLESFGKKALPALTEAANSPDHERAWKAKEAIRTIEENQKLHEQEQGVK